MCFELIHFRDAQKVLKKEKMLKNVTGTLEYIDAALNGAHLKGELLRQALEEMDWRNNGSLNIFPGRRYKYKGFYKRIAIEGSFNSYEYLIEGLMRLQLGFEKGKIIAGVLMLPNQRGEKTPYGSTKELVTADINDHLFPTINMPISVALFSFKDSDFDLNEKED